MPEARNTIGEYLTESNPLGALWLHLVDIVYRDSPRQAHLERLSRAARTYWLVYQFNGEVDNGGFSQFFSNSSGDHAAETADALRQIGAKLCVELLQRALTVLPNNIAPRDRNRRCELLFAFEERFPTFLGELDRIYDCSVDTDTVGSESQEDLFGLMLAFMRANATETLSA